MAKTINIAIDGPAGAGKSTIAKALAKSLGYCYVDTGAIYRTVAYFLDLLGVSPKDADGVERYIDELTIKIEYDEEGKQHMLMNGMDVSGEIRTQDISQKASLVSAHKVVRDDEYLVQEAHLLCSAQLRVKWRVREYYQCLVLALQINLFLLF